MECALAGKFCNILLVNSRSLRIERRMEMRSHITFYPSKFKITSALSQANHNPSLQVSLSYSVALLKVYIFTLFLDFLNF